MATQQIHREQWAQFLNGFSKSHAGKLASLDAFGPGTGDHHEARPLPFAGFEVEADAPGHIIVMLGTERADHVSHTITAPVQVWHKSGPDEADEVVEVRADDGVSIIVRFRTQ